MESKISNKRRVEILLQPYLSLQDLMEWYGSKKTYASTRLKEMHNALIEQNKKPVRGKISAQAFMDYEGIELNHFVKLAKIEKEVF